MSSKLPRVYKLTEIAQELTIECESYRAVEIGSMNFVSVHKKPRRVHGTSRVSIDSENARV